ncbi:BICD family-like cargo adapter 2 isoform X2 [Hydra vulgaris]|uniref:BICD family-like cargo adapter 2 isoform X2 n=1 Tax=Hydra vulgaris TaxID=6087 RepID=A0ABM4CP99_HYDVU
MLLKNNERSLKFKSLIHSAIEEIRLIKLENTKYKWKENNLLSLVANLKSRNDELEKNTAECQKQLRIAQVTLSDLKTKIEKEEIAPLKNDFEKLKEARKNEVEALKNANIKIEKQDEELLQMHSKYSALRIKKNKLSKLLKQQMQTKENDNDNNKTMKMKLKEECLLLVTEIEAKNSEIAEEKKCTESIKNILQDVEIQNIKLVEQLVKFRSTEKALKNSICSLESVNKSNEQKIKDLEEQIKYERCDLVERRKEVLQLKQDSLAKDFTFQEIKYTMIKTGAVYEQIENEEENS